MSATRRIRIFWLESPKLIGLAALMLLSGPAGTATGQIPPAPGSPDDVDPAARFTIGRLKYSGGGDWYSNPSSLPNLLEALSRRTNLRVAEREANVRLTDDELYRIPMLYMNGHGAVKFTEEEVRRLRDYLQSGGFLWADDNYGMDKYFREQISRVFPDRALVELPFDHPIYHVFYDLEHGTPKIHEHDGKPAQGLGIFDRGRLVVFYTYQSDIGDGIEDEGVHNDPPEKREQAMKMAVNVVLYDLLN